MPPTKTERPARARTPLGPRDENVPPAARFGYRPPTLHQKDEDQVPPSPCKKQLDTRPEQVLDERGVSTARVADEVEADVPSLVALFNSVIPDPDDLVPLLRLKPTAGPYEFKDRINELSSMIKPLKAGITEQRRACLDLRAALGKMEEDLKVRFTELQQDRCDLRAAKESLHSGLESLRRQAEERGQRIKQLERASDSAKREFCDERSRLEKLLEAQQSQHAKEQMQHVEELRSVQEAADQREAEKRAQLEGQVKQLQKQLQEEQSQHLEEIRASQNAAAEAMRELHEEQCRVRDMAEHTHAEEVAAMQASHAEALSQQAAEAERRLAAAHSNAAKERSAIFEATEQQRAEAQAATEAARNESAQISHRLEEVRAQVGREQAAALAAAQREHAAALAQAKSSAAEALDAAESNATLKLEELRSRAREEQAAALSKAEQNHKEAMDAAVEANAQALKMQAEEAVRRLESVKEHADKEKADALLAAERLRREAVAAEAAKAEALKAEALAAYISEEMRRRAQAAQGQVEALAAQERSHEEALAAMKAEHTRQLQEVHTQANREREDAFAAAKRRHTQAVTASEAERREALAAQAAQAELRVEETKAQAAKSQADALAAAGRRHTEALAAAMTEQAAEAQRRLDQALEVAATDHARVLAAKEAEAERKLEEVRQQLTSKKDEELTRADKRHAELLASQTAETERRLAEAAQLQADALAAAEQTHMQALAVQAAEAARRLEGACVGPVQAQVEALAATERSRAEALATQVQHLERQCRRLEADRRTLHNTVQELRGNVRVFARVRPCAETRATVVKCLPDEASLQITVPSRNSGGMEDHSFSFNRVFGSSSKQMEVFDEVSPLVQSALDGYKVCLFSYGQTGSGKTHTMLGEHSEDGRGIIPRSVEQVVQASKSYRTRGWEYSMEASCVEIYNDTVRDLLAAGSQPTERQIVLPSKEGCPRVSGTETEKVTSPEVARALVQRVAAMRVTKRTHMNDESSRSHVLFLLYVTGIHKEHQQRLEGFLCFADLAGSERVKRSGVVGAELKEACKINQSLAALSDVFGALGKGWDFVPFRNSKLTQLLQPCLGGDGKALMFVHLSPAADDSDESHLSLQFASRVNACCLSQRGCPKRNITPLSSPGAAPPGSGSKASTSTSATKGQPLEATSRSRRQTPR